MRLPAAAQPVRPAPAYFPQPQASPPRRARHMPSESLDEDRLSDFPESEASFIAKQAQSEYRQGGSFLRVREREH